MSFKNVSYSSHSLHLSQRIYIFEHFNLTKFYLLGYTKRQSLVFFQGCSTNAFKKYILLHLHQLCSILAPDNIALEHVFLNHCFSLLNKLVQLNGNWLALYNRGTRV